MVMERNITPIGRRTKGAKRCAHVFIAGEIAWASLRSAHPTLASAGKKEGSLRRYWCQFKHPAVLGRRSDIPAAQRQTDRFKLLRVLKGKVRRPATFFFDELDRNLDGIFPFAHELHSFPDHGFLRLVKSADQSSGSDAVRVLECGDEVQWPKERKSIFFMKARGKDNAAGAGSIYARRSALPCRCRDYLRVAIFYGQ